MATARARGCCHKTRGAKTVTDALIWIAVFLAMGVPALLLTRWLVIKIERRRKSPFVNDMMDAIRADRPRPDRRQQLLSAGRFGLLLPIWPLATAALLTDLMLKPGRFDRERKDREDAFNADGFLTTRLSVAQAAARETIADPRGDRPHRPFAFLAPAWNLFLTRQQAGCELWAFEVPAKSPNANTYRYSRGYCWVRAGKIIAEIAVEGAPGVPLVQRSPLTHELRG